MHSDPGCQDEEMKKLVVTLGILGTACGQSTPQKAVPTPSPFSIPNDTESGGGLSVIPDPSPSVDPNWSPEPWTPGPKEKGGKEKPKADAEKRRLDEGAVLAMLKEYLSLYNGGAYAAATAHLSSDVDRECSGGLADALAQNHHIEEIDYDVSAVRAWDDEPNMADVVTVERYGGQTYRLELGLAFAFEDGGWTLDDLYPLGAGAFC